MPTEIIDYRGYELHINPEESGFKAKLKTTGAEFVSQDVPHSPDKPRREQLIAEAKATVDALLDWPHDKAKR